MRKLDPGAPPERISPHCVRIPLPDPFVPGVTSVFVLESAAGEPPWLLDAGADMPESMAALRTGLEAVSLAPESVRGTVLSHTHLDHSGGLLHWTPPRLLAHEAAVAEMRNREPASSRGRTALHRMGAPDPILHELAPESEPVGETPFANLPVSDPVRGSEGQVPGSSDWRWLLAEGHAPGHLHGPPDPRRQRHEGAFLGPQSLSGVQVHRHHLVEDAVDVEFHGPLAALGRG